MKTMRLATWVLAAVPPVLLALCWGGLPDRVPVHWGLDGAVTYGARWELVVPALLPLLLLALLRFLPRLDPKRRNYEKFQTYYEAFSLVLVAFIAVMMGVALLESFRPGTLSMGRVVSALVGLLFLFLGNLMGKVKPNFFMGIRNPWTLSDPDVWNRAHRLGGGLFFLTGLASVVSAILLPEPVTFAVLMAGTLLTALIPTVMSYFWYKKVAGSNP